MKKSANCFKAISLIIFFSLNVESFSQDESISLCDINMKIGMKWEEIIPILAKNYFYSYHNVVKMYTIWDPVDKQKVLGIVAFDSNDKLSYVSKKWFEKERNNCPDGWELLYTLLNKYQDDNQITANTTEIFDPNYKAKFIEFYIGKRNITVNIQENGITDLDESLR